jgi:hypothetical protein
MLIALLDVQAHSSGGFHQPFAHAVRGINCCADGDMMVTSTGEDDTIELRARTWQSRFFSTHRHRAD